MISFRKALFTLLAPLGAATIIGTGFATWVFGIGGESEPTESIISGVGVTTEITNGSLELITAPNLLVFSEGTQGKNDLFDGISFYTNKQVDLDHRAELIVSEITNNHFLSLVYDRTGGKPLLYFSRAPDSMTSTANNIISGELKKSQKNNGFAGVWTGEVKVNSKTYNVNINLGNGGEGGIHSGSIQIKHGETLLTNDSFTFKENTDLNDRNITVTDSTFTFRYYYDNPKLINEDETGYRLNVKFGMSLNSREPFEFEFGKKDNSLTFDSKNDFTLSYNSGVYSLDANIANQTISYTNLEFEPALDQGNDEIFKYGVYRGTSISGIPCELTLSKSPEENRFHAKLQFDAAMNHYFSLIDDYTNRIEDGYFNITSESNINYAQTVLHINIDRTHAVATETETKPYIEFTCQLANYLRYASSEVKPTSEDKYYGLRVASLLGGWEFKIKVSADYTFIEV